MTYLITKMLLCLVLSALLGSLIGWQLRGLLVTNRARGLQDALDECHAQLQSVEKERDALFVRAEQLEQANQDLNDRLMAMPDTFEPTRDNTDLATIVQRLQVLERTNELLQSRIDSLDYRAGSHPLKEVGGLDSEQIDMFRRLGIETTAQLLEQAASHSGRQDLIRRAGIDEQELTRLIEVADLLRIPGIGSAVANLLQAAGIQSVADLAGKKAYRFALKLKQINADKQLLSTAPGASIVGHWIDAARAMTHSPDDDSPAATS